MNILVVDDSQELLVLLNAVLTKLGHNVVAAPDSASARSCKNFDLALVDWNLNDANGVDFLEELSLINPKAKLILISASRPDAQTAQRLASIGASYEAKPLTPMKLSGIVSN